MLQQSAQRAGALRDYNVFWLDIPHHNALSFHSALVRCADCHILRHHERAQAHVEGVAKKQWHPRLGRHLQKVELYIVRGWLVKTNELTLFRIWRVS